MAMTFYRRCNFCDVAYDVYSNRGTPWPQEFCSHRCFCQHNRAQLKKRRAKFHATVPSIMLQTDPAKHPRPTQLKIVSEWQCGPIGLILYGASGTGKTRACYYLFDRLIDDGYTVKVVGAVDFQKEIINCTKPGGDGDLDDFMDSLLEVDVLCIDDLDKARFSPRVEAEFFNLIDKRTSNECPIIISANSSGNTLASKMAERPSVSIFKRRISEASE